MTWVPRTVGVVGAGTMGLGIAQVCANAGLQVMLFDIRTEQVSRALDLIAKNLSREIEKGRCSEELKETILSNIQPARLLGNVRADVIIEAIAEVIELKQSIFRQLEDVNGADTIFVTNTSSISVTSIASEMKDPSRCVGLHFFNPADRMKLVEIISGDKTNPELVLKMRKFSALIGKTSVETKDSPGFIVNRVARHFYTEAFVLEGERIADVQGIDALMRSAGFRMGPFELMDLIGVDTNLAVTKSIHAGFKGAVRFSPSLRQQQLVDPGRLGRKSGRGFYNYGEGEK